MAWKPEPGMTYCSNAHECKLNCKRMHWIWSLGLHIPKRDYEPDRKKHCPGYLPVGGTGQAPESGDAEDELLRRLKRAEFLESALRELVEAVKPVARVADKLIAGGTDEGAYIWRYELNVPGESFGISYGDIRRTAAALTRAEALLKENP